MIEKKKTHKADLEKKRFAFFQIGLILAGSLCLAAFEFVSPVYSSANEQAVLEDTVYDMPAIPIELMPNTQQNQKKNTRIYDEVDVVVSVTPTPVVTDSSKSVNMNLGEIENLFGETGGTGITRTVELTPTDNPQIWPKFPGNMGQWIGKNMNLSSIPYPASGTIYVNFIVSKTGEITDVKISKSLDRDHDRAALEVVKKMPKWIPGEVMGKPVAVNYQLPIRIKGY
ncbi:MAG: energy transducer TonB [Crocinitomicaceae bacterium]